MNYSVGTDVELVKELLDCTTAGLSKRTGIGTATLERWLANGVVPSSSRLEAFYSFAFSEGLRLNAIKAQLYSEQAEQSNRTALFHGSKTGISGPLSLGKSRPNNDFGRGFYCGESLEQSAMFVSDCAAPSLYMAEFDAAGLHGERFHVDENWMLAVAWNRGRLRQYAEHPLIKGLQARLAKADYVIAPIADNRMFEVIDSFIDGEITDVQCQHSLSATDLGSQHVFVSEKALENVTLLERCYLCADEKRQYLESKRETQRIGIDKGKVARRQFRGEGRYIEELLS